MVPPDMLILPESHAPAEPIPAEYSPPYAFMVPPDMLITISEVSVESDDS
jgi:hypothetical protein